MTAFREICAHAPNGQTVAEPTSDRNSRRRIASPKAGTTPNRTDYSRDLRSTKWGSRSSCTAAIVKRQCPLWVKSRHRSTSNQCPLYPQKRTSAQAALNGDADRGRYSRGRREIRSERGTMRRRCHAPGNWLFTRGQNRGQNSRAKFSADVTGCYPSISRKE